MLISIAAMPLVPLYRQKEQEQAAEPMHAVLE